MMDMGGPMMMDMGESSSIRRVLLARQPWKLNRALLEPSLHSVT